MLNKINKLTLRHLKKISKHKYVNYLAGYFYRSKQKSPPRQPSLDRRRLSSTRVELEAFQLPEHHAPKITIIMPSFNRASLISRAIKSVLRQSYGNFQLIVVDDGSVDDTKAVVKSFQDDRIQYVYQKNQGVSAARNTGLKAAIGEYVAYIDSDNEWGERYLEYSIKSAVKLDKKCIYSVLTIVGESGVVKAYRAADFDQAALWDRNFIDLNVFFHEFDPKNIIEFDVRLRRAVDWDYIVRVTNRYECSLAYFDQCEYSDASDDSRLTISAYSLYTKIVRAKNYFYSNNEGEMLRLARLAVAIVISAPSFERAKWGDYYYARALQKYLIRLGYSADIIYADSPDNARRKFDVNIVIRGRRREKHQKHQLNILWVISHPETVSVEECSEYDHVFTASHYFEAFLRLEGAKNVTTLLQASDPELFEDDTKADRSGVIFVGRTKGVDRRFVVDLVKGLDDAHVIGDGWEKYIGAEKVEAQWVQYPALPSIYRSKDVILAEHWRSMRLFGIVANRISDAVGCGARVLSDKVRGDEYLDGRDYQSCLNAKEAFAILSQWESTSELGTGNAFVSMKDQAATIDNVIASLLFRFKSPPYERLSQNKLVIFHGVDWYSFEWSLLNRVMPELSAKSLIDLEVSHAQTDGPSYLEFRGVPIEMETLCKNLSSQPLQLERHGMLDERLWRLFSVGKHKPCNSRIATILAPSVESAFSEFPDLISRFDQIRIWDPLFTSRVVIRNGAIFKQADFADTARTRIRRYLLDAESVVTAIESSLNDKEFYHHVALATGTYVMSTVSNAENSLGKLERWKQYFLAPLTMKDSDNLATDAISEKLRTRYWEQFCDQKML